MKRMCQALIAIAAVSAAGIASARGYGHGSFAIGFGLPVVAPVYVVPPPVYYVQPQVVYVAPPPVYYRPAYVYYNAPAPVYRQPPPVVYERSEIRPAPLVQPQAPAAPELAPRAYRN